MEPIATEHAHPCSDGLLVHAQDQSDLRVTLAVHNREDGEEILHLAHVAQLLSRLQLAVHFLTLVSCNDKTDVAHRDIPPKTTGDAVSLVGIFPMCGHSS